jgi:L-fuculose-phosphate aldolase
MSARRTKTEHALRRDVARISASLWERGYVANHDGNVSARAAPGRIVTTPTATSKRLCDEGSLIVVDEKARVVSGTAKPASEMGMHLAVYAARSDVGAVVHAHPPYATARAASGKALACFLAEAVVSLGRDVPLVPFAMPGAETEKSLAPYLPTHDAVLLGGHGVLAWGDDPEQAYLRLELVEHLSKIAALAETTGGVRALPEAAVATLLDRRRAIFGR